MPSDRKIRFPLYLILLIVLMLGACGRGEPPGLASTSTSRPSMTVSQETPPGTMVSDAHPSPPEQFAYPAPLEGQTSTAIEQQPAYPELQSQAQTSETGTPISSPRPVEEATPTPPAAATESEGNPPDAYPPPQQGGQEPTPTPGDPSDPLTGTQPAQPSRTTTPTRSAAGTPTRTPNRALTTGTPLAVSPVPTGTVFSGPTPTEYLPPTAQPPPRFPVTVSIWHSFNPQGQQLLNNIIKSFQAIYPDITFDVLYIPVDELRARYESEAYRGSGPSLVVGPAEWGADFYEKGLISNLAQDATPEFLDQILPAALQEVQYQNRLIGLPLTIRSGVVMFRNPTLIPTVPATYEELVTSAQRATRGGNVGAYLDRSFYFSAAHLYGLGGSLTDEEGKPAFANDTGEEWLELLGTFDSAGATELGGNQDLELFKDGRVGIIFGGTWNIPELQEALGSGNLVIDPWPAVGSDHLSGFIQTENIYLNSNLFGEQRYATLLLMGFLLAPEVQSVFASEGQIPVVQGADITERWMEEVLIAFERATAYPLYPQMPAYWNPINDAIQSVFEHNAAPESALEDAAAEVEANFSLSNTTP